MRGVINILYVRILLDVLQTWLFTQRSYIDLSRNYVLSLRVVRQRVPARLYLLVAEVVSRRLCLYVDCLFVLLCRLLMVNCPALPCKVVWLDVQCRLYSVSYSIGVRVRSRGYGVLDASQIRHDRFIDDCGPVPERAWCHAATPWPFDPDSLKFFSEHIIFSLYLEQWHLELAW